MIYVYDGTWDGLMCLIHRTAQDRAEPEAIIRPSDAELGVLFDTTAVENDPKIAEATAAVLKKRVSNRAFSHAWFALLSCDRGGYGNVDIALWRMLAKVWEGGKTMEAHLADESVHLVRKAALRTESEYNKLLGVVRFKDIGGVFYAALEPDCDVLTLLADHFCARLPDRGWILHDLRREKAVLYNGKTWALAHMPPDFHPPASEDDACANLWREFYRSTTTLQRLNYKAQRGHMPKKYWKHLTETPGELHGKVL
jgi:probable DNA metabolism protein